VAIRQLAGVVLPLRIKILKCVHGAYPLCKFFVSF
jgi:hypothetical protein